MMRSLFIVAAIVVTGGCQSQYGCGSRVPPPATGSYGTPNTYYQNVTPRSSAVPATAPRTINPSLSNWRSADDDSGSGIARQPSDSAQAFAASTTGSSVRVRQTPTSTSTAPTTKSVANQVRLNAMPINEVKQPVAPASFQSPVTDSGMNGDDVSNEDPTGSPPKQPPSNPPSNALRNSSAALRTDSWQSRSSPTPNRIAGG